MHKVIRIGSIFFLLLLVGFSIRYVLSPSYTLYWFIPDGMRAEPELFTVFKWAQEGKLPNIKKLMDMGSYGYSYPNFPSHTPTNFAALMTGSYPEVNGVDDGPMRIIGKPLDKVAIGGFSSTAKNVPPIWKTLEDHGFRVSLISIPGSTPPEIQRGTVLRGRWGGWGPDFFALLFESKNDLSQKITQGRGSRFFYFGPALTHYLDSVPASGWNMPRPSFSQAREITLTGWGATIYGYMYDSTDDKTTNYDKIAFSMDKTTMIADLTAGNWSPWTPVTLNWKPTDEVITVPSQLKIALVKLDDSGFFRVRVIFNTLNQYNAFPQDSAEKLLSITGPQVDFPDNFPAQLIYYPEDKKIFQDEADMSFAWHTKAVDAVLSLFKPHIVIHDIYTPNQMLTSRWWMHAIDPNSDTYEETSEEDRQKLWQEVHDMYVKLDTLIGEIMNAKKPNAYIVLSSDHGAVPINTYVNLNNLFAQKGWLKFTIDPTTGEPIIDWKNSIVIYLKMAHVYINPEGLAGDYARAHGPAYELLRSEVIQTLKSLRAPDGTAPLSDIITWEDAQEIMRMDPDRAGDLILANEAGFGWNEEMTSDLRLFEKPLVSGYKQAIKAQDVPGMWTPFVIVGPGIKSNHFLGDKPFSLIDQYPTIMKALNIPLPDFVQGKPLDVFK
jgi:predicted AlkP superfamily phosphohydrolase/phosphomutase